MVLQWDKPNSAGPSLARGAAQRRNRHWAIAMEFKKNLCLLGYNNGYDITNYHGVISWLLVGI
jgi:hypothetical protein